MVFDNLVLFSVAGDRQRQIWTASEFLLCEMCYMTKEQYPLHPPNDLHPDRHFGDVPRIYVPW